MKAYFFEDRKIFSNITSMDNDTISAFLRFNTKDSLFAKLVKEIQEKISASAAC